MSKKKISDPEEKKLNAKAAFGLDDDEDEKFDPKKQTSSSKTKNSETCFLFKILFIHYFQ